MRTYNITYLLTIKKCKNINVVFTVFFLNIYLNEIKNNIEKSLQKTRQFHLQGISEILNLLGNAAY